MIIKDKIFVALGRCFPLSKDRKLGTDGLCCPVEEKIIINPDCENVPRAILHECCHAIIFSGGIFEAIDNEKMCEVICEQMARSLDENFELKWRRK